jgi:asparagine synthase (glutamine-hydrolysing)
MYAPLSAIEKRFPFLDQHLVEFLTTIPLDQLLRPGQRRSLMRRALANILPPDILHRETKSVMGRCYPIAIEHNWAKVESVFPSPVISRLGYVERDSLYQALLATKNGQISDYILRLLKALSLEFWLRDVHARGVIAIPSPVSSPTISGLMESRV